MEQEMRMTIQRTLILTLGEEGAAVSQRVDQMLEEWGVAPVVAVRHLALDAEEAETETVEAALHEISRLAHRATLTEIGYSPDRLDELVLWVVGPPQAPLAEMATMAAERAVALLGLDPFTLGLALSVDGSPGAAETLAQGWNVSTDSFSLFYLAGPVNEAGLTLDDNSALYEQAARFLALHTRTLLRDAPVWIERARGWGNGLGVASFGLTWLAWPGDVAQAHAVRWLVKAVIEDAMGDAERSPDAETLLREGMWSPPLLISRLTPPAVAKVVRLAAGDAPTPSLWALLRPYDDSDHPLLTDLEATVKTWDRMLGDCASAWRRATEVGIQEVIVQVRDWTSQALNAGGLDGARALVKSLEQRLSEWAAGVDQRVEETREEVGRIERDGEAALETLAALLTEMLRAGARRYRWRDLIRLLRSPIRWVRLWTYWRKAQDLCARYMLLQAAALEARVAVEQMERACAVYWAAGAELQSVTQGLDRLESKVCGLLGAEDEPPEWPRIPLLLGDDPDTLLVQLAEQYLPTPQDQAREFLAQWGSLSKWWSEGMPQREAVERWLVKQVAPLATVSIWEIARCRYPEPQVLQRWMDELVAQTSPLWRWDPTVLSEVERACIGEATVLLGPPDGGAPWNEDESNVRVLSLERADRLAVVSLRWGIPRK
jgi:hypothetical protein